MGRTAKPKAKIYEIIDETFYPDLKTYGITLGYVMQVDDKAALTEFFTLNPKMKHGDEVIAVDCELSGSDSVKEGKKWLKEHKND